MTRLNFNEFRYSGFALITDKAAARTERASFRQIGKVRNVSGNNIQT
jgi:hypothetical protein